MKTKWDTPQEVKECFCLLCGGKFPLDDVRFFSVLIVEDTEVKAGVCQKCLAKAYNEYGPHTLLYFQQQWKRKRGIR